MILAGDHGEAFWEHDDFGHGRQLYQESVRVPLVLMGGGAGEPSNSDVPVSLIDIHPTLLRAAGLEDSPVRDLRLSPTGAPVFSETDQDGVSLRAGWMGTHKVIWDRNLDTKKGFDLAVDPDERHAIYADLLLQRALPARFPLDSGPGLSIAQPVGEETGEALQVLGYTD